MSKVYRFKVYAYRSKAAHKRGEWVGWDWASSREVADLIAADYRADGFIAVIVPA